MISMPWIGGAASPAFGRERGVEVQRVVVAGGGGIGREVGRGEGAVAARGDGLAAGEGRVHAAACVENSRSTVSMVATRAPAALRTPSATRRSGVLSRRALTASW